MLHNDKPNAEKLDRLARVVLARAIDFERAKAENTGRGGFTEASDGRPLCEAVKEYREAMVAEMIGGDPGGAA